MNLETFSFEIDADGVAHAVFDVPGRSMNTLTGKAIADIIAITNEIATNDKIVGAVLSSGKASGFCAGADLGEMDEQAGGKPKADMSGAGVSLPRGSERQSEAAIWLARSEGRSAARGGRHAASAAPDRRASGA